MQSHWPCASSQFVVLQSNMSFRRGKKTNLFHFAFATDQECTQLSHLSREPALPSHTFPKLVHCDTQHHQKVGWVWMRRRTISTGVPTWLTCCISFGCGQRQVWVYPHLTIQHRAGACPFSRMWVGSHCLGTPGIPHCLWSGSLWITDQGTNAALCHCFLISSTALLFLPRGHFLHSA